VLAGQYRRTPREHSTNDAPQAPRRGRLYFAPWPVVWLRTENPGAGPEGAAPGLHARRGGGGCSRALHKTSKVTPRSQPSVDRVKSAPAPIPVWEGRRSAQRKRVVARARLLAFSGRDTQLASQKQRDGSLSHSEQYRGLQHNRHSRGCAARGRHRRNRKSAWSRKHHNRRRRRRQC